MMTQATEAMERITAVVGQDLQHHRADRRHRLPDQPPGAQRLGRSGAGGRSRQGLCGGRGRSPAPGAVGGQASSEVKALIEQSAGEVRAAPSSWPKRRTSSRPCWTRRGPKWQSLDGIAHDSREQASAIEEVNTAVRQIDEMTQHNAALVEETNAAIEQTEAQATELDRIVEVFPIGRQEAPGARASSRRRCPWPATAALGSIGSADDAWQCRRGAGLERVLLPLPSN